MKKPLGANEQLARMATQRFRDKRIETVEKVHLQADAVRGVLDALVALDFETRRKVLRWAADFYEIDPGKLGA